MARIQTEERWEEAVFSALVELCLSGMWAFLRPCVASTDLEQAVVAMEGLKLQML